MARPKNVQEPVADTPTPEPVEEFVVTVPRKSRVIEKPPQNGDPVLPADSASAIYKDKAGPSRAVGLTEGGSNLASMVAQYKADEARRLAKDAG